MLQVFDELGSGGTKQFQRRGVCAYVFVTAIQ